MRRLAILSTHPIQYNAPLFRMLHEDDGIELQVFFSKTWDQVKFDPDFQREVTWDIPVSEGYPHSTHNGSTRSGQQALIQAIQAFHPDALLVYGWNFPGHFYTMRQFHGRVPVWFRGDSHLLNPMPVWKKAMRKAMLTWVYRHVDVAFSVGTANEAYYRWSGLNQNQLTPAPHATDLQFWQKDNATQIEEAKNWREEMGIPKDAKCVGFAGKLEPLKQVDLIIRSTLNSGENHHAIIAGTGPLETALTQDFGSHSQVHFVGFVNQSRMPVFYRMLDALALASFSETWGLCVNESMACGTPCVVSDRAGCAQDIFLQSDYGQSVMWNDETAWAKAIRETLKTNKNKVNWSAYLNQFRIEGFVKAIDRQFRQLES
ncbi:glycosyltransferase family 4 protein [Flavobacteriales bacterium]|nr:glycosyltransferase family 4 protein [Flavobacteriales bacterium]